MLGKMFLILVLAAMVAVPASAQAWNYNTDFVSVNDGANGWNYGFYNPDGVFELSPSCPDVGWGSIWEGPGNPSCVQVRTGMVYDPAAGAYEGAYFWVGGAMRSPDNAYKTTARWTAAADGVVKVDAFWTGALWSSTGSDSLVWVLKNGTELYATNVVGFAGGGGQPATAIYNNGVYSGVLNVVAGDTIDFVAGNPGDRVFPNDPSLSDWMMFDATITTVPEPSSFLALACGLVGVVGAIRRRK